MKKFQLIILLFASVILVSGCKSEERVFEIVKTEVYPMLIDSTSQQWEINIPIIVKGHTENPDGEQFKREVLFSVDLIAPDGKKLDTFEELDFGTVEESKPDTKMDVQFYVQPADSGEYTAKIRITDRFTKKTITKDQKFKVK
ncbi:hypothetical protein MASR1M107_08450 [Ignavibacteriales bacterium]